MVKVKNIRGDEYSGTIGKTTTASKWKRVRYLRKWVSPTNPRTELQMYQRSIFTQAVEAWHELSREQQEAYNRIASPYGISGYNLFVRRYIELARMEEKYYAPVTAELKVIDEEREPVKKATVIIKKGKDIVYRGFTDEEGKRRVTLTKEDEPYDVAVMMPGYKTIEVLDTKVAQLSKTFTLKVLPPVIDP
jgi:hypothetical protein